MKILLISKRRYTGKDLLLERYGRVFEFSRSLAQHGHEVLGLAMDYRGNSPAISISENEGDGHLSWKSLAPPSGLREYGRQAKAFQPDLVLSVSDVFHVIIGDYLAKQHGVPHIVDLYDDYEAFTAAKMPGIRTWYRRALARAFGIICVSNSLTDVLSSTIKLHQPHTVITNAVDRDHFRPMDQAACRAHLGLPAYAKLIGTAGALHHSRGIERLFEAYQRLRHENDALELVLAGPIGPKVHLPKIAGVHYLGVLPYTEVPYLFNALDIGVIPNLDSAFGRTCFPQKLYEFAACHTQVVAARVGASAEVLAECQDILFTPYSADSLTAAICNALVEPCMPALPIPDWKEQGEVLDGFLRKVVAKR